MSSKNDRVAQAHEGPCPRTPPELLGPRTVRVLVDSGAMAHCCPVGLALYQPGKGRPAIGSLSSVLAQLFRNIFARLAFSWLQQTCGLGRYLFVGAETGARHVLAPFSRILVAIVLAEETAERGEQLCES